MSCERVFDLLLAEDNPSDVELTLRAFEKSCREPFFSI